MTYDIDVTTAVRNAKVRLLYDTLRTQVRILQALQAISGKLSPNTLHVRDT